MKAIKITIVGMIIGITYSAQGLSDSRGYDPKMLEQGKAIFQANCAVCHGQNAEGTVKDWHKPDAQGKYPPPPLNGTAHTWHHPVGVLFRTIQNGSANLVPTFTPHFLARIVRASGDLGCGYGRFSNS